jgi:uroporphyrinogen-III synthase
MTRRILVTRPRQDAEPLAEALARRGWQAIIEPMLDIVAVPGDEPDLAGVQALLATSANGVRALAKLDGARALPVWTVGEVTARCARELGFNVAGCAGGDVAALATLVVARLDPAGGALLHATASHRAGDLAGQLAARGFAVRRAVLYAAQAAETLSPALREALAGRAIEAALFFSPRTAETFARLVEAAALGDCCAALAVFCFSQAVADRLAGLAWRAVVVAARPSQAALLAALDGWSGA